MNRLEILLKILLRSTASLHWNSLHIDVQVYFHFAAALIPPGSVRYLLRINQTLPVFLRQLQQIARPVQTQASLCSLQGGNGVLLAPDRAEHLRCPGDAALHR